MLRGIFIAVFVISAQSIATAQAVEPNGTLSLACKGRSESGTGAGSNNISKGVILDVQTKIVRGFTDGVAKITGVTETAISFSGTEEGSVIKGRSRQGDRHAHREFNQVRPEYGKNDIVGLI